MCSSDLSRFQATVPADGSAAERLTTHLREVRVLLLGDAALRAVLSEIALRARRDEKLGAAIAAAEEEWFNQLRDLLRAGIDEGGWTVPVDPGATAALLIALCKGACLPVLATDRPTELAAAFDQALAWLTSTHPESSGEEWGRAHP